MLCGCFDGVTGYVHTYGSEVLHSMPSWCGVIKGDDVNAIGSSMIAALGLQLVARRGWGFKVG